MDDKEIEDILSEDEDFSPMDLQMEQAEEICGDITSVRPPPQVFLELPQPLGSEYPLEFTHMVNKVHAIYRTFPQFDHTTIYEELASLSVKTIPTPTLQLISQELHKIQAVKERLAEIMVVIGRVHTFKKRQVDILKESWINFSKAGSADKRKADAIYRMSEFESDFVSLDSLWKTANHILHNLDSSQEILSRRITIIGHELRMYDLGRTSVPDFNFRGESLGDEDIGNPIGVDEYDEESPTEAEELEF